MRFFFSPYLLLWILIKYSAHQFITIWNIRLIKDALIDEFNNLKYKNGEKTIKIIEIQKKNDKSFIVPP